MSATEQQLEKSKRQAFSVNIPDEKKEAWARIAKAHNRPMGWLFLEMVDRMIEADSIHIYKDSDYAAGAKLPTTDIEEAIKAQMSELDTVTPDDVRSMIAAALTPLSDELEAVQSQLAMLTSTTAVNSRKKAPSKSI
jgi:predicted transcriptional regulator